MALTKSISRFATNTVNTVIAVRNPKERALAFILKSRTNARWTKKEEHLRECAPGMRKRFADGRVSMPYDLEAEPWQSSQRMELCSINEACTLFPLALCRQHMFWSAEKLMEHDIKNRCGFLKTADMTCFFGPTAKSWIEETRKHEPKVVKRTLFFLRIGKRQQPARGF